MTRSKQDQIFAQNNKYEGNIFKKFGRWFKRLKGWQKGIFITVVVLLIVAIIAASYIYAKLNKIGRYNLDENELSCVDVDGYINILLLGVDSRDMDDISDSGADAIMILSIKEDTGDVKLISVYRDTYLKMGKTDTYGKITDSCRIGGPAMTIKSLNQAMDMNISKFVVVNFKVVSDLVNAVNGITVNVTEEEIEQLNKYTIETADNIGQKHYKLVEKAGKQKLEGVQAVSYGRIRKGVGDDYKRTERMREVITKVFGKLQKMSITKLDGMLDQLLPQVQTNLSNNDMIGLAMRLVNFKIGGSIGWPYDVSGGYIGGASYVFPSTLESNTIRLHQEIFGQKNYKPSSTVTEISNSIIWDIDNSVSDSQDIDTENPENNTEMPDENEIVKPVEPVEPEVPEEPSGGTGENPGGGTGETPGGGTGETPGGGTGENPGGGTGETTTTAA